MICSPVARTEVLQPEYHSGFGVSIFTGYRPAIFILGFLLVSDDDEEQNPVMFKEER